MLLWLVFAGFTMPFRANGEEPGPYFLAERSSEIVLADEFSAAATSQQDAEGLWDSQLSSNTRGPSVFRQGTLLAFFGVDGAKQPQDFGANAHLGVAANLEYAGPLVPQMGIGFQIGTRSIFHGNAVQVFELLGESKDRYQNYTTVGAFKRWDNGFSLGAVYDFLNQESFDSFTLSQWRIRASIELSPSTELGITLNLSDRDDTGFFNTQQVQLEPIEQLHIYLRRRWQTGVESSFWIGVADEHSEENVVTGTLPPKTNQILFGSEIHVPLNHWLALYGETNLMMPADTGAVDAYLGFQFAPQGVARSRSRSNRYRAMLPVGSNPSFTTNLTRVP